MEAGYYCTESKNELYAVHPPRRIHNPVAEYVENNQSSLDEQRPDKEDAVGRTAQRILTKRKYAAKNVPAASLRAAVVDLASSDAIAKVPRREDLQSGKSNFDKERPTFVRGPGVLHEGEGIECSHCHRKFKDQTKLEKHLEGSFTCPPRPLRLQILDTYSSNFPKRRNSGRRR